MGDGVIDFNERCRLCIEPKRLSIDIFSDEGRKMKLKSKINKNLPLKVSQTDGLPSQVCYQCLFRLETWVSFKQLCLERDRVMKTWSQSFLDETPSEANKNFNAGQSNCKKSNARELDSSGTSRTCPNSRNSGVSEDGFGSGNQMDDTKSDTSVWEVVKTDDIESQGRESPDRDNSQAMNNSVNVDFCGPTENSANAENLVWNQHKARKLSKVSSTGSDTSASNEIDQACNEPIIFTSVTSTDPNKSFSSEVFSADAGPQPLKRKRGRPSKASLQRERELKKLREQEKLNTDQVSAPSGDIKTDANLNVETAKDDDVTEGSRKGIEGLSDTHPSVMIPEFIPVEREGVTEVILDDPEFGSMKFTLSVLGIDSTLSSTIFGDNFKCHSYASSSGNLSSDSLPREDFVGFETPTHSNFLDIVPKDVIDSLTDDISESRSPVDVGSTCSDKILSVSMKRKHNSSDLADSTANSSISEDISVDDGESKKNGAFFPPYAQAAQNMSRSFESLPIVESSAKRHQELVNERNAYSDGELSESPPKRFRRKSLIAQELSHGTSASGCSSELLENP